MLGQMNPYVMTFGRADIEALRLKQGLSRFERVVLAGSTNQYDQRYIPPLFRFCG